MLISTSLIKKALHYVGYNKLSSCSLSESMPEIKNALINQNKARSKRERRIFAYSVSRLTDIRVAPIYLAFMNSNDDEKKKLERMEWKLRRNIDARIMAFPLTRYDAVLSEDEKNLLKNEVNDQFKDFDFEMPSINYYKPEVGISRKTQIPKNNHRALQRLDRRLEQEKEYKIMTGAVKKDDVDDRYSPYCQLLKDQYVKMVRCYEFGEYPNF